MIENKALLDIIKENFDLKISHHEIETLIGNSISSDEVIELYGSMGISLLIKADSYEFRKIDFLEKEVIKEKICLLYTSPSPRDRSLSRMPSSA